VCKRWEKVNYHQWCSVCVCETFSFLYLIWASSRCSRYFKGGSLCYAFHSPVIRVSHNRKQRQNWLKCDLIKLGGNFSPSKSVWKMKFQSASRWVLRQMRQNSCSTELDFVCKTRTHTHTLEQREREKLCPIMWFRAEVFGVSGSVIYNSQCSPRNGVQIALLSAPKRSNLILMAGNVEF
jgi:hypothetical protein